MKALCMALYMALAAAFFTLLPSAGATAGEHDRARRAYEAGEVVSLGRILDRVRSAYTGRVLEIDLDEGRPSSHRVPWVYSVKLLTPQGNVLMLRLNAKTMEILDVRGHGAQGRKKRR
ncbi:MAG: PepSY domain-containing protein [Alphaproteobacteria bacterium]